MSCPMHMSTPLLPRAVQVENREAPPCTSYEAFLNPPWRLVQRWTVVPVTVRIGRPVTFWSHAHPDTLILT